MAVLLDGFVNVSGREGSGKTLFAFTAGAQPEDTAFVDVDIKGSDIVAQINESGHTLGFYADMLHRTTGMKEVQTHNEYIKMIGELEKAVEKRGKPFELLVWDTWTPFEETMHPMIVTEPNKYKTYWSPNGVIKGAEQWKAAFKLESEIMDRVKKCARLVVLTAHLKPETVGGKRTGKMIPDIKKPVIEKCIIRLYLMPSATGAAPIGLMLKRWSKQVVTPDGIKVINLFPQRIEPCTWDTLRAFVKNPVGNGTPTADQIPNEFERSIIEGTLTDEQKWIMSLQTNDENEAEQQQDNSYTAEFIEEVKAFRKDHNLSETAKKFSISIPEVGKIMAL